MKIPNDLDTLKLELQNNLAIATATGWTLAALVFAWTRVGKGGRRTGGVPGQLTIRQFSEMKIRGLRDRATIMKYRQVWEAAIEAGIATTVTIGEDFDIPEDVDFFEFSTALIAGQAAPEPQEEPEPSEESEPESSEESEEPSSAESVDNETTMVVQPLATALAAVQNARKWLADHQVQDSDTVLREVKELENTISTLREFLTEGGSVVQLRMVD